MTHACQVKVGRSKRVKKAIISIVELIQIERCLMTSEGYLKAEYLNELKEANPTINMIELFLSRIPVKCV